MQHEEDHCDHDKVYSNVILTSNPPQQDWICRKCRSTGRDVVGSYMVSEYDELMKMDLNIRHNHNG